MRETQHSDKVGSPKRSMRKGANYQARELQAGSSLCGSAHELDSLPAMTRSVVKEPILIVEDDRKTSQLLSVYFEREGYSTVAAYTGRQALDLAAQHNPIFTILDVMLPDLDGWEICHRLRSVSSVPILILSAIASAQDRVKGLSLGADDYVAKPFSFQELVARVKAILRRVQPQQPMTETLTHDDLTVDVNKRRVTRNDRGVAVTVTSSELRLLQALMAAPGRVFMRDELLNRLYPSGGVVIDRVIDVHIANLRQKIEDDPAHPRYILTARGRGYQFADAVQEAADAPSMA